MLNKFKTTLLLASTALVFSGLGQATTVYLRDTANPTSHFASGLSLSGVGNINSWNGNAGLLDFEMSLTSATTGYFNLLTYCIDPVRNLSVGPANGTGGSFDLIGMSTYFAQYTPAVSNVSFTTNAIQKLWANAYTDSKTSATKAAAFQFLLWEYIADSSFDLTAGVVSVSDVNVRDQAIAWNTALASWTQTSNLSVISGLYTKQSFIYEEGVTGTNENVPEPATYAMLGAGLLALGFWRRKR